MKQLVIYRIVPANEAPFHRMFEDYNNRIMKALGFEVLGVWSAERRPAPEDTIIELVYLLSWPDLAAMEAGWAALNAHPDIIAGREAIRAAHGPSVTEVTNRMLTSMSFSPDLA